jgi:putative peptide zinc metalloprotease protein
VAVSFQVVLVVGSSKLIAPINAAGALNYDCPACTTTAIADQIVVTLTAQPSRQLLAKLQADLKQLNAVNELGANGTPTAIASEVATVQNEIDAELNGSGLRANSNPSTTTSTTPPPSTNPGTTSTTTTSSATTSTPTTTTAATTPAGSPDATSTPATGQPTSSPATDSSSTPTTTSQSSTTTSTTTTVPSSQSTVPGTTAATTTAPTG